MFEVTKEFNFEAGHTLDQHTGKCRNLHGHNYKVFVTMQSSDLNSMEMVKDFYDLNKAAKPMFDEFDHSFMFNQKCKDKFEKEIYKVCKKHNRKVMELPYRSTAENMAKYFLTRLNSELEQESDRKVIVSKVVVYETPTSFATYTKE